MTNHRSLRAIFVLLVILFIALAGASTVGATPPGNDGDLCHGANQETCRPDPNPNGQDCEAHGNNVDGNDDHCATEAPSSTPTGTPIVTPDPSTSPSTEPSESPKPSVTPSPEPSATPPAPSPSDSPNVTPTPRPSETPSTSSSPTLKPSSKPTPEQRVITPPSTDTEPDSTARADGKTTALAIFAGLGTLAYLLIWGFKRPYGTRHR